MNENKGRRKPAVSENRTKKQLPAKKDASDSQQTGKVSSRIKDEVILFAIIAVCILLFISNFGVGGAVGNFFSSFMFGVTGTVAYALPVMIMAVSYMVITFKYDESRGGYPVYKLLCIILFIVFLCMFFELLGNKPVYNALDSYMDSVKDKSYGGFLGGLLCSISVGAFGRLGSYVIDITAMIICLIIYTGRSLMEILRKIGRNVKDKSVEKGGELIESTKERLEERFEERKAMRMEKKAQAGVSFDTLLTSENRESSSDMREIKESDLNTRIQKDMRELDATELSPLPDDYNTASHESDDPFTGVGAGELNSPDMRRFMELEPVADATTVRETVLSEGSTGDGMSELGRITEPKEELFEIEPITDIDDLPSETAEVTDPIETAFMSELTQPENIPDLSPVREERTDLNPVREERVEEPSKYVLPPVELLKLPNGKSKGDSEAYLAETAMKLQQTLKNFGVNVQVTDVTCGPTVTRYEIQPEPGIKVSKIINLTDDIKLNLAAADIRMEAPIPGKAAIGIEVPNKEPVPVFFRELVDTPDFKKHPSRISFAAGKDIAGQAVMADIAKMPHLLIAGSTGSGKSVCINTIIMSILYHARPDEVKLIMIDPKVVELSVYNGIPHLLIPVVTDPKKAAGALNWAVSEMMERYDKFAAANVRDMKGYNELAANDETKTVLPQIVVIVDELADLMMVASNDVEDAICRLAQLARAAGIHLIIATQRPSVNVITGLIKANMPSRIAFAVTSGVDSRTILDMVGAEKLLGKGDMLYYPQGLPKPMRLQGAFVSDHEVADVVDFIKKQCGETVYSSDIEKKVESLGNAGSGAKNASSQNAGENIGGGDGRDELFFEAGKLVIEQQKASIGHLQRKFKIGFNRAARIMDQLEEAGVVSGESGTKSREILMSMEDFLALESQG